MRPSPRCFTYAIALLSLSLVYSNASSQPKQFHRDGISGGAAANHSAVRVKNVTPLAVSPKQGPARTFIPGIGFLAFNYDDDITETGFPFIPPDPCGAAGPDRLIAVVNAAIDCRDKAGNMIFRDSLRDFFAALVPQTLGTLCFDPKVVFDANGGRFVVVALEQTSIAGGYPSDGSRILVAVSITPSPATATTADWYYTAIDSKLNIGGTDYWADYPGLETDEEAVYITTNMFPFAGSGFSNRLWIIDKGLVGGFYTGGPASWSVYDPVPGGYYHMTMMPALMSQPSPLFGTFLVGYSSLTNGGPGAHEFAQVIRVDNPLTGPTFTGQFVDVGDLEDVGGVYGFPPLPDAPQLGGPALIAVNDSRALDAVWRNNSLWFTTTIDPNTANDPVNAGQTTAHWFRLNTSAVPGPITLAEQGNIGGEDITPGAYTFFPAVAVNGLEDAKFGFAASGPFMYCGAYFAGHEHTDAPGTVQPAGTVQQGIDYYLRTFGSGENRWGDYSGAAVDPIDDRTFWVFNQYADLRGTPTVVPPEDGRWGTAWKSCMVELPLYDFGDLPDPPYATLLANNGPRHQIVPGVYLGNSVDAEPDGQPVPNAQGDDNVGTADEDGIISANFMVRGASQSWVIRASQNGWLDMWIDFNGNGSLLDAGELAYSGAVTAGDNNIPFTVPMSAFTAGFVGCRLRYNLNGPLPPTGPAPNGEVEDYMLGIYDEDWGDAPAPYPAATAVIQYGAQMGALIDHEPNNQPQAHALGDDLAGVDDEDGVTFTTTLNPTHAAGVNITVSLPGFIDAWIDFNHDGVWSAGEKILDNKTAVAGVNSYSFNVPSTSSNAFKTFARFRYGRFGNSPLPTGFPLFFTGEVEDYEVQILADIASGVNETPRQFAFFDPMPNPFNPTTTLSFALPKASSVVLQVFDVHGQLVATLLDEKRGVGVHRVTWDGRDRAGHAVASGVYLCRIQAGSFTATKRLVLLK